MGTIRSNHAVRSSTEYARNRSRCPRCGNYLPAAEPQPRDGLCLNCRNSV